jgi:hypothetical protein
MSGRRRKITRTARCLTKQISSYYTIRAQLAKFREGLQRFLVKPPNVASSTRGFLERGAHSDELVAEEDELLDGLIAGATGSDWGGGTRSFEEIGAEATVSSKQLHYLIW